MKLHYFLVIFLLIAPVFITSKITVSLNKFPKYGLILSPLLEDCKKERLKTVMDFVYDDQNIGRYTNLKHVELTSNAQYESKLFFFNSKEARDDYTISGSDKSVDELLKILQQQIDEVQNGVIKTTEQLEEEQGIVSKYEIEGLTVEEIHAIIEKEGGL